MTFSDYAQGLFPYCSFGKSESDYFTELVGNFVADAAMDACRLLKRKPDTKYRYVKGIRAILAKDAQYVYDHRDVDKFSRWLDDRMSDSDSYDKVSDWLASQGIQSQEQLLSDACAELLESVMLGVITAAKPSQDDTATSDSAYDTALLAEINEKIKSLPRPADVLKPEKATPDEKTYIEELYRAYGDAEGMPSFSASDFATYPNYSTDLDDRRIDFYAAVTIQRGVLELGDGSLSNQFDVLKSETLDGVKDTAKRKQDNGYECMLAVMEQAASLPVTNYVLSASPYWISGKIKKGVCHHLVNDGKLRWVRRKNG